MKHITVVGSHTSAYLMHCPRLPTRGEFIMGDYFSETLDGGKGSNQALALARFGALVDFVGVIGDDAAGRKFQDYFKENGVNLQYVAVIPGGKTAMGLAFIDPQGQIIGATDPGVLPDMCRMHVDAAKASIESCSVLLTQLEIPADAALYACQLAKEAGKIAILNPAPVDQLRLEQIRCIDILTPNEPESKLLLGIDPQTPMTYEALAQAYVERALPWSTVITLGGDGAMVIEQSGGVHRVSCPKVKVVDTSGAGDCFNAAVAYCLAQGKSLLASVKFAVRAASVSVTRAQVWPSYPTLQELL